VSLNEEIRERAIRRQRVEIGEIEETDEFDKPKGEDDVRQD
jgi:hypothetical protein